MPRRCTVDRCCFGGGVSGRWAAEAARAAEGEGEGDHFQVESEWIHTNVTLGLSELEFNCVLSILN